MKRFLSLLLSLSILLSTAVSAAAASNYSDLISGVLDDMSTNDSSCSGAPQQSANGAYRLAVHHCDGTQFRSLRRSDFRCAG